ncbi:MAG TPA: TlpA disulfide reductase family protein [Nevskiaceae bacterium]|nr:TlpA disulfide reductase family protein [Nevskiaceae bacterium]
MTPTRRQLLALLAGGAVFGPLAAAAPAPAVTGIPADQLGRITYLDFWASWCTPCAAAFPWLNQMQDAHGPRGLRVLGIGLDAQTDRGDRFLQQHPARFSILRDPEGRLAEHYGVEGMPYAVIIDRQGQILHRHTGFRPADRASYEQAIIAALAERGGA